MSRLAREFAYDHGDLAHLTNAGGEGAGHRIAFKCPLPWSQEQVAAGMVRLVKPRAGSQRQHRRVSPSQLLLRRPGRQPKANRVAASKRVVLWDGESQAGGNEGGDPMRTTREEILARAAAMAPESGTGRRRERPTGPCRLTWRPR